MIKRSSISEIKNTLKNIKTRPPKSNMDIRISSTALDFSSSLNLIKRKQITDYGIPVRSLAMKDLYCLHAKSQIENLSRKIHRTPDKYLSYKEEYGISIPSGGFCRTIKKHYVPYFRMAYAAASVLRSYGCDWPIEFWCLPNEYDELSQYKDIVSDIGGVIRVADISEMRCPFGWQLKIHAIRNSNFRNVLHLDADNICARNPSVLKDSQEFKKHGAIFWSNMDYKNDFSIWLQHVSNKVWKSVGIDRDTEITFETGQIFVDKVRHSVALEMVQYFSDYSEFWGGFCGMSLQNKPMWYGDTHDFHVGFVSMKADYLQIPYNSWNSAGFFEHLGPDGELLFQHCCQAKLQILSGGVKNISCNDVLRRVSSIW